MPSPRTGPNEYRCPLDRRWMLLTEPRSHIAWLMYDAKTVASLSRREAAIRLAWWRASADCGGAK